MAEVAAGLSISCFGIQCLVDAGSLIFRDLVYFQRKEIFIFLREFEYRLYGKAVQYLQGCEPQKFQFHESDEIFPLSTANLVM